MPKEAADQRYAQVPLELIQHPETGPYEIAVYATLDSFVNRHSGECRPHVRTIAGRAQVHPNTVCRAVKKLVKLGFVEVVEPGNFKKKKATRYRLRRHLSSDNKDDPSSPVKGRLVTPEVTTCHLESDTTSREEPLNNNNPPNPPSGEGGLSPRAARRAALKAQREADKRAREQAELEAAEKRQAAVMKRLQEGESK